MVGENSGFTIFSDKNFIVVFLAPEFEFPVGFSVWALSAHLSGYLYRVKGEEGTIQNSLFSRMKLSPYLYFLSLNPTFQLNVLFEPPFLFYVMWREEIQDLLFEYRNLHHESTFTSWIRIFNGIFHLSLSLSPYVFLCYKWRRKFKIY